jgi:hypothetical protein
MQQGGNTRNVSAIQVSRNAGKAFRLSQIRADPTNGFLWAKPNRHRNIWHMDTGANGVVGVGAGAGAGAAAGGAAAAAAAAAAAVAAAALPPADLGDYASVTDEAM